MKGARCSGIQRVARSLMIAAPCLLAASVAIAAGDESLSSAAVDRSLGALRIGLAIAGLLLFAQGVRLRRRGTGEASGSGRRVLLGVVAAVAFAANYNLFLWTGLHRHELFHYYLGSKYFPELGYFGLYTCSAQASFGDAPLPPTITEITDLRSKRRRPAAEVMAAAPACRDAFTPARWAAFRADVAVFRSLMGEAGYGNVLRDHGYNPSPTWTLFGRTLASLVPATPAGLWFLARLDLALLVALFAAIGWAFGFDAACIAVIAWGASGHTRYQWTGDAFLRQLWLSASVVGVCAVRKGRSATGGALLALAALERVFPACFFFGYGLREIFCWVRERKLTPGFARFVAAAATATVLLVAGGTAVAGRGVAVWREFAENTHGMLSFTPKNGLGLEYALRFSTTAPPDWNGSGDETAREESIQAHKERTLEARRGWQAALLAVFATLFGGACWRGARRDRSGDWRLADWESLAMGAAAIPFLTMPGSYYLGFVVMGAALATRRPRIGIALLAATAGWAFCVIHFEGRGYGFAASSWILLAYAVWLLAELWLPAAEIPARPLSAPATAAILPRRDAV